MVNAYTKYVKWANRRKRLHGGGGSVDIWPATYTTTVPGGTFQPYKAPSSFPLVDSSGTYNVYFLFWSITGGADGPIATKANPPPTVTVGNTDIVAIAWYVPEGPPGGYGVWIDAFDVDLGDFSDDDFVSVTPDSNGTLTANANSNGFVDTINPEDIEAYQSIDSIPFSEWTIIGGTHVKINPANKQDLQAEAKSSDIAFAFYKSPPPVKPPRKPGVLTKPGPISIGYQALLFKGIADPIEKIIKESHLKALSLEAIREHTTQKPTELQCGIKDPHLHYNGKIYLVSKAQWNKFLRNATNQVNKALRDAESVGSR